MPEVDVLIPTYNRPAALAVTLAGLVALTYRDFRVVVSDQSEEGRRPGLEAEAVLRVLRAHGQATQVRWHLPRRGMAEHRQFLLDMAEARYALFFDDDLILEHFVIGQQVAAIRQSACGFVGSAVIGLSYLQVGRVEGPGSSPYAFS